MLYSDPIPNSSYSKHVFNKCFKYTKHHQIAQQIQSLMIDGYYLRKCSIDICANKCSVNGVDYLDKLPLVLFKYAPIRSEPWFNNGEYFVGSPPVLIVDLYKLNFNGWRRNQILAYYPEVSWKELEAALKYMYRIQEYKAASAA